MSTTIIVIVFFAIGYWFGAAGLLAGGAGVAVIAGRARKRLDQVTDTVDSAISSIDSSIKDSKGRLDKIESSALEVESESRQDRSSVDPYDSLILERPKLRDTE